MPTKMFKKGEFFDTNEDVLKGVFDTSHVHGFATCSYSTVVYERAVVDQSEEVAVHACDHVKSTAL